MTDSRTVVFDLGEHMEWVLEMTWPEGVTATGPQTLTLRPADPGVPCQRPGHEGACSQQVCEYRPGSYPDGGISPTLLREISFSDARATLRRQLEINEWRDRKQEELEAVSDARLRAALADGVNETYLALLASKYVRITNDGVSHPQQVLAKIIRKTPSTVKGHLWQSRRRDLLEGSAGRSGGVLTPKAQAILAQEQADRSAP